MQFWIAIANARVASRAQDKKTRANNIIMNNTKVYA